jgi:LuxR family transcriptional regulator, maltose regulon positive regulatory protein
MSPPAGNAIMAPMSSSDAHARPAAQAAPLLATKLYLPRPRSTAVARPRLVARVREGLRSRLTLLAAPAGFGKSTLLAQALAAERSAPAWLALDEGDDDPARFWSYVFAALDRASSGLGAAPLAVLRATPSAVDVALAELLNALAAQDTDLALVLDDYHAISSATIHQGLGFLLDHAPPQLHLLIASRVDPPLPLARWRARGELVEIRAADLRFRADEAQHFLSETMGLRLDDEAVAALEARTEGWAAGLQLAALSLQGQADPADFIAGFGGSHRHVVDYLVEEVLERQPDHIRAFLLQTSILARMSAPLCAALVDPEGRNDRASATILTELDRQNLFLIALDNERRWYRYHHLFADLLRHRLQQEQPARVPELHRRAARWFAQQGVVNDALDHALAAGDSDLLAQLLEAHGARLAASGETQALQRWLDALPRTRLLASPRLCLTQASALLLNRQTVAMEPFLAAAAAALAGVDEEEADGLRGELLAQRAHVAIERGAFAEALGLARAALGMLPQTKLLARSNAALVLGYALMILGQTAEAVVVYAEHASQSRAAGNALTAIFIANELVKLLLLQGRLREARAEAEGALAWVESEGWHTLPPTSALHIWRGNTLIEQGMFADAEAALLRAIELSRHGPAITSARAHTFLARLRQIEGDGAAADAALTTVERIIGSWERGGERAFFEASIARGRLMAGDIDAAQRWLEAHAPWDARESPSYFREIELLTRARIIVLDDAAAPDAPLLNETRALLPWLRERASAAGRGAVVLETLILEALALARSARSDEAQRRLDAALDLAAPEGFVGLFADMGPPVLALLAQNLDRRAPADALRPYVTRLLRALAGSRLSDRSPSAHAQPPHGRVGQERPEGEALTERELEVLRRFAAGMTSPEIARHFVVSVNTVKTQLKSIYGKLDAHSRAEAIARARERGLLP